MIRSGVMLGWRRTRLKYLVAMDAGTWGDEPLGDGSDVACVRAADFDRVRLRVLPERLPERSVPKDVLSRLALRPGDLVLEKSGGGADQPVGGTVMFDLPTVAVCSNFAARLRPVAGVDPRFLTYLMSALYRRGVTDALAKQTTGIANLDVPAYMATQVVVPMPAGQVAIADYLDTQTARIDALVSGYRHLSDRLLEQRIAITHTGATGASSTQPRRRSSLAWADSLPEHWDEVRLTLLARLGSGHTPSRLHPEWWIDGTIPWITTGEVWQIRDDRVEVLDETREMISQLGLSNSAAELHPAETVVLSRTASAGFSAIMGAAMATSQDFVTWTCGPRLRPRYLLICLRAMRPDLLGRLAMGSTHKTIYVPDIQSICIPLPPLDEQDQAVAWTWSRLKLINDSVDGIHRQISLLVERRQAVITAAVTGELEIPGVAA